MMLLLFLLPVVVGLLFWVYRERLMPWVVGYVEWCLTGWRVVVLLAGLLITGAGGAIYGLAAGWAGWQIGLCALLAYGCSQGLLLVFLIGGGHSHGE